MKRINYGEVAYLVGGHVADLMVIYTARLSSVGQADAVKLDVLGPDGNLETASFALGPGITMTAETTRSELNEPDNSGAVAYIEAAMERLAPRRVGPMTADDLDAMAEAFREPSGPDH